MIRPEYCDQVAISQQNRPTEVATYGIIPKTNHCQRFCCRISW